MFYALPTFCSTIFHNARPSRLKLGVRETSTGDNLSQCDIVVNVVVKRAVRADEGLAEGSNADDDE